MNNAAPELGKHM